MLNYLTPLIFLSHIDVWQNELKVKKLKMPYNVYVKAQALVEKYDGIHSNNILLYFCGICTTPSWMRCGNFCVCYRFARASVCWLRTLR